MGDFECGGKENAHWRFLGKGEVDRSECSIATAS